MCYGIWHQTPPLPLYTLFIRQGLCVPAGYLRLPQPPKHCKYRLTPSVIISFDHFYLLFVLRQGLTMYPQAGFELKIILLSQLSKYLITGMYHHALFP